MQSLLIPIQESCLILRILNGSFHAIEALKDQFAIRFTSFFESKSNAEFFYSSVDQNAMEFPNGANPKRDAVFNSLDAMLKGSLDRLKSMRESISREHIHGGAAKNYKSDVMLIRALCLEGKLGNSLALLRTMVQERRTPDIITHNYLMNAFCKRGDLGKAEWLFNQMICRGPSPTCATYNTLMGGYCLADELDKALDIFSDMTKVGLLPNRVSCNILVHALCRRGILEDATKLLDSILAEVDLGSTFDVITSTIFMDGCFKTGKTVEALSHWGDVVHHGMEDTVSYNVNIHGHCLTGDINRAQRSLAEMLKTGCVPDACTYNTFIGHLCKSGKMDEACCVFGTMRRMGVLPDEITFEILIRGLCSCGDALGSHGFLCLMLKSSFSPRPAIWNAVIDAYGKCGDLRSAVKMKDHMLEFDAVLPNAYTYNILIRWELRFGNTDGALYLKEEMQLRGISPDLVTYNSLIGSVCSVGDMRSALDLYFEMQRRLDPDLVTYTQLLKCCCLRGEMRKAEWVFFELRISGLAVDHVPFMILMKKYFKMGELDRVHDLYLEWSATGIR